MSQLPEWVTAHGPSLFDASIRSVPSDFQVTENCTIEFTGEGEHDYLWIEKTGTNTHWVEECLAKFAGVPQRDVGFAGMKDRHAITRQWFSVRRVGSVDWPSFSADGIEILDHQVHRRKLRRGAHKGNAFKIALRGENVASHTNPLEERLSLIAKHGVPNYFGEQRFGRGGNNIEMCKSMFAGRRLSRSKRGIALSTARSLIFNTILDARVRDGSWNSILPGELANLDGSRSVFAVDAVTDDLRTRCAEKDIHPTASLWGDGSPLATAEVAALESPIAEQYSDLTAGLAAARVEPASRATRLLVADLQWEIDDDVLWLEFSLSQGGYATSVLKEIAKT